MIRTPLVLPIESFLYESNSRLTELFKNRLLELELSHATGLDWIEREIYIVYSVQ